MKFVETMSLTPPTVMSLIGDFLVSYMLPSNNLALTFSPIHSRQHGN